MTDNDEMTRRKASAANWFAALRDDICHAFEALEQEASGPFFPEARAAGSFRRTRQNGQKANLALLTSLAHDGTLTQYWQNATAGMH